MICPNCHQEVKLGAAFCGNCGFQLIGDPQQTPWISPPEPQPWQQPAPPSTGPPQQAPLASATATPPPPVQPDAFQQPSPQPAQPMYGAPPQPAGPMPPPAPLGQQYPNVVGGNFVGGNNYAHAAGVRSAAEAASNEKKAIAAFVCGVVGCVGWLIPIVGVILSIIALVFGITALKSRRRVLAIIAIVLAIPVLALSIFGWIDGARHYLKAKSSSSSSTSTGTTDTQTISTPCYTTKIPASLTLTQTTGSCTFSAVNLTSGEQFVVKVLQSSGLSPANLAQIAQEDAANVFNAVPGDSITSQKSATFAGSPAYTVNASATDGSKGSIAYVYRVTAQGNLVIVLHTERDGSKNFGLTSSEESWSWQ